MRYLKKNDNSAALTSSLKYISSHKASIRAILLSDQHQFCAYSEKYICEIDDIHIEHFNPRLKNTPNDGYYNWYMSYAWMNLHKDDVIEDYLPILSPYSLDLVNRIRYNSNDNVYEIINKDDREADNLIKFLGFNKNELAVVRAKHIIRLKDLLDVLDNDKQEFLEFISADKEYLSFATALEQVFSVDLTTYVSQGEP